MSFDKTYYEALIIRYFTNEISENDVKQLHAWLQESEENRSFYKTLKSTWILSGLSDEKSEIDSAEDWRIIKNRIESKQVSGNGRTLRLFRLLPIAAAILLLLGIGFNWFSPNDNTGSFLGTEGGELVSLPDGSTISLFKNAHLSYDFTDDNQRKITLSGAAFFDVSKDESRPFIIGSPSLRIEVLGTQFLVEDYGDVEAKVLVRSGKVGVRTPTDYVIAQKAESVRMKGNGALEKYLSEDKNSRSAQDAILVFEHADVKAVMSQIKRHFGLAKVIYNGDFTDCFLTSRFEQKSLPSILKIIESTLGITTDLTDSILTISGSCKK